MIKKISTFIYYSSISYDRCTNSMFILPNVFRNHTTSSLLINVAFQSTAFIFYQRSNLRNRRTNSLLHCKGENFRTDLKRANQNLCLERVTKAPAT